MVQPVRLERMDEAIPRYLTQDPIFVRFTLLVEQCIMVPSGRVASFQVQLRASYWGLGEHDQFSGGWANMDRSRIFGTRSAIFHSLGCSHGVWLYTPPIATPNPVWCEAWDPMSQGLSTTTNLNTFTSWLSFGSIGIKWGPNGVSGTGGRVCPTLD